MAYFIRRLDNFCNEEALVHIAAFETWGWSLESTPRQPTVQAEDCGTLNSGVAALRAYDDAMYVLDHQHERMGLWDYWRPLRQSCEGVHVACNSVPLDRDLMLWLSQIPSPCSRFSVFFTRFSPLRVRAFVDVHRPRPPGGRGRVVLSVIARRLQQGGRTASAK